FVLGDLVADPLRPAGLVLTLQRHSRAPMRGHGWPPLWRDDVRSAEPNRLCRSAQPVFAEALDGPERIINSEHELATVDVEHLAGHETPAVAGQVEAGGGDVIGSAEVLDGQPLADVVDV